MNRRVLIIPLLAFAAGLLAYAATRLAMSEPEAALASPEDRLAWLAREFELTPEQTAAADRLQSAYAPLCEAHCEAIAVAQDTLAAAGDDAARSAAAAELERLKKVCAESTRAHLQAVAALMSPAQASRFLALMEPRVTHSAGRAGAPALDAAP